MASRRMDSFKKDHKRNCAHRKINKPRWLGWEKVKCWKFPKCLGNLEDCPKELSFENIKNVCKKCPYGEKVLLSKYKECEICAKQGVRDYGINLYLCPKHFRQLKKEKKIKIIEQGKDEDGDEYKIFGFVNKGSEKNE